MTDVFTHQKHFFNICNIRLRGSENSRSVDFGVDAITFRTGQLWQKVLIAVKDSWSLEFFFKAKINTA